MFLAELAEKTWHDLAAVLGRYVCGWGGDGEGGNSRLHNTFDSMSNRTYPGVVALAKVILKHVHFEEGR
jgi:hypothetical protein